MHLASNCIETIEPPYWTQTTWSTLIKPPSGQQYSVQLLVRVDEIDELVAQVQLQTDWQSWLTWKQVWHSLMRKVSKDEPVALFMTANKVG